MIELKEIVDKVIVDFDEYHKNMSELELLRKLMLEFDFNDITENELREELNKANKIYNWWV